MKKSLHRILIILGVINVIGFIPFAANAMPPPPNDVQQNNAEHTKNGGHGSELTNIQGSSFDTFKLVADINLPSALPSGLPVKLYLQASELNFQKRWLRDRRTELTKSYLKNTKERYQSVFDKALHKAFANKGVFQIVDDRAQADWILTSLISELIIHGPDVGPGKDTFVQRAGEAKLSVQIFTQQDLQISEVIDRRQTRQRVITKPEKTSRMFNQRDFRSLFSRWSDDLAKELAAKIGKPK